MSTGRGAGPLAVWVVLVALLSAACAAAEPAPPAVPRATAAPIDSSREAWTQARSLADAGRPAEALVVLRAARQRDPGNVHLRWLEAGATGWTGDHAEAVRLYERLIDDHPELARDIRGDLGAERLYAGDLAGALRDLDLRVTEAPDDREARKNRALALSNAGRLKASLADYDALLADAPDDMDLMMERARVLAWMGHNRDAAAAYRTVLSHQPENRRARLGLAMNENWQGLHRRAAARLDSLVADPQADPEGLKALAFAHYWAGEPEAARRALDDYRARVPDDREALDLSRTLEREQSPSVTGGVAHSTDSDQLRLRTTRLGLRVPMHGGYTVALDWQRDRVRDDNGIQEPTRVGLALETMWSGMLATRAAVGLADLDTSRTMGLGEFSATWRPRDLLRVDAGVSRDVVLTRLALARRITAVTWVEGADWNATERLTLRAAFRQRRYSDDNRAHTEALSAAWRLWSVRHGRIAVTFGAEQLHTRLDLDDGYYDPAHYVEWGPGIECQWTPREDLTLSGDGRLGRQRERGSDSRAYVNGSLRGEWTVKRAFTLALEGGRSDSDLSGAGYRQHRWALSVSRGF